MKNSIAVITSAALRLGRKGGNRMSNDTSARQSVAVPDLAGDHYFKTIQILHQVLNPKTYFEIGTLHGDTLALARCSSLAVDPAFDFTKQELIAKITAKPLLMLFQMSSDDFFAQHDPERLLNGKLDFAFLDGMHRCEFLLRDFINTERFCKRNSVIALHDCLPVELVMTQRIPSSEQPSAAHRQGWWTGDVWRTALLLKRVRPDLSMVTLDAQPTGLILVTNLDSKSCFLSDGYANHVAMMLSWRLSEIGIPNLFEELGIEPASGLTTHEQITARFWL